MIDDVLCEARWQMVWYLRRYPDTYTAHLSVILRVLEAMEALERRLERNPFFLLDDEPYEEMP